MAASSSARALPGPPSPAQFAADDIYIAIMGVTGAGKSTFISQCCRDASLGVGHSLKSETKEVNVFHFMHGGKRIHLIDTPGFDDTYRTDSDVLQDLAYWLTMSYKQMNIKLTGIVYLHRISDPRMTGNAMKNLRTFRKLCGKKSMSSVVLATTMWENVNPADGDLREADLRNTAEFWGDMLRENSTMMRHLNNHHSAMNIIMHLMQKHTTTVLEIQTEMVDQNRPLDETEAGREVEGELIKQRNIFEQRLLRTENEMKEALANNDKKHAEEIAKDQERLQKLIRESEKGREDLRISLENLIKEKDLQHQRDKADMDAKFNQQREEYEKERERFNAWKAEKEQEDQQREKQRLAAEAGLKEAQERGDQSDELTVAMYLAAVQKLAEQAEEHEKEKEQMRREAEKKQLHLQQEKERLEQMNKQRIHQAAYQDGVWKQQQQRQQREAQRYYYQQQQQQYHYQQQQQYHYYQQQQAYAYQQQQYGYHQQQQQSQGLGAAMVGGAASMGMASALGLAPAIGCNIM